MQERHRNRKQYFEEQGLTTERYVIPYIEAVKQVSAASRVLEVGCGEGGNMSPFIKRGCEVVGVDINTRQIAKAKEFISDKFEVANVRLLDQNIYEMGPDDIGQFDIVMLRDVIEHIPDQDKFMKHLRSLLKPDGIVFFGFPPWRMPFGGHQQVCKSRVLSNLPYFHLLPMPLFKMVLKIFGETEGKINSLVEIKETGISIRRFQNIVSNNDYKFLKKTLYLINPNYEVKFGLKKREQLKLIEYIPYFRDFVTTCCYSIVGMEDNHES